MNRRTFIKSSTATAAGLMLQRSLHATAPSKAQSFPKIPRWRGFNITNLMGPKRMKPFVEDDFKWMAEFGFDFARIPMSYWCWSDPKNWKSIDESILEWIDKTIEYGETYGIHINLNFHRVPGYCVNGRELEQHDLFEGSVEGQALAFDATSHHWETFAKRYKGIPSEKLSFDLMNEPPWMDDDTRYKAIVRHLVEVIRAVDPDRLIVADGSDIGQTPIMGIEDLGLVQSTRGYLPKAVSHYTATWVPENEFESFEIPTWPMADKDGKLWNKARIRQELIEPWMGLKATGTPIHVGEWGCFNKTPHEVTLAWMEDILSLWKELGWGWAMWNFRGNFGILDSGRSDVAYEDFRGHQLDRKMLELLQRY